MKIRALATAFQLTVMVVASVMRAAWQEPPLPPMPSGPPSALTPAEIEIYRWAPTLIQWTPKQIEECPVLHKLRPAANRDQLPMILERAGQTAMESFADFPQIACQEAVTSEMTSGGRPETKHQKFRFIVTPRAGVGIEAFDEYRTDLAGAPADRFSLGGLFMITSGFASTWLYLSPHDQRDNHFRYFGTQRIRNRGCYVVAFAQDPDTARRVWGFQVPGKGAASLLLQGLAWIDTRTFQILRVMTWLLAPREDVDLSFLITTVDFDSFKPIGWERTLWLPRDVNVWMLSRGVGLRNTHHYSDYKLFRVESTIKPAP